MRTIILLALIGLTVLITLYSCDQRLEQGMMKSRSEMRAIGRSLGMYVADNSEMLPVADKWATSIEKYERSVVIESYSASRAPLSYAFNPLLSCSVPSIDVSRPLLIEVKNPTINELLSLKSECDAAKHRGAFFILRGDLASVRIHNKKEFSQLVQDALDPKWSSP